ncbi:hypothetical protein [Lysinibacillus sp. NPDC056232]|uniref:hypothetical protein n=1 Tax=unclassified Lysinibacillus TaxID=2636778 RepID=UPI0035DDD846
MSEEKLICKSCGSDSFTKGIMGNGFAYVKPADNIFKSGSPLIFTICKKCGEVASIKIKNFEKF